MTILWHQQNWPAHQSLIILLIINMVTNTYYNARYFLHISSYMQCYFILKTILKVGTIILPNQKRKRRYREESNLTKVHGSKQLSQVSKPSSLVSQSILYLCLETYWFRCCHCWHCYYSDNDKNSSSKPEQNV